MIACPAGVPLMDRATAMDVGHAKAFASTTQESLSHLANQLSHISQSVAKKTLAGLFCVDCCCG